MKLGFCYKTDNTEYYSISIDKEGLKVLMEKLESQAKYHLNNGHTAESLEALKMWDELHDLIMEDE